MKFWEWIKYILNTEKALARITNTHKKQRKNIRSDKTPAKGTTYEEIEEGNHKWQPTGYTFPISYLYLICITYSNEKGNQVRFYSYSFIIGVDNHASKTISNQRSHFIRNFHPMPQKQIKGISATIPIKGQGTVIWKIEDDKGRAHTMDIKDSIYFPESSLSIIYSQYWAQKAKEKLPTGRGTYMSNIDDECVLY